VGDISVRRALREPRLIWVNGILAFAVVVSVFVTSLSRVQEVFPGAHSLGVLAIGLGVSYIASWMIYYLAVWRPETAARDRAMLEASVSALQVAGTASALVQGLQTAAGDEPTSITQEDFAELCKRVRHGTEAKMVDPSGQSLPVTALFVYYADRATMFTAKVERWQAVIETDLLRLVYNVVDSTVTVLPGTPIWATIPPSQDLEWLTVSLVKHCQYAMALRRWLGENAPQFLAARGYDISAVRTDEPILDLERTAPAGLVTPA
jgi:hypothetical protein